MSADARSRSTPGPVTVYVTLERRREQCQCCGSMVSREYYGEKVLTPTGEAVTSDNGYETSVQPVFSDAQGRRWERYVSIDYANNVAYFCEAEGWRGTTHKPRFGVRVDAVGSNPSTQGDDRG